MFTKRETTAKGCSVHRSTEQKVCSEAFNSSSDIQAFTSPRKACKRKHEDTHMNDFDKDVLCQIPYAFYEKGEYPIVSRL